jgi:CRISPR-associated protein Csd2
MSELYCDPNKRHDFVYFFDVTNGNPNGDPDAGNMPRVDPETMHGIVTDVCIKRKIRDYASAVLNRRIFIQSETALNALIREAAQEARDANGKPIGSPLEMHLSEDKEIKKLLGDEDSELSDYLQGLEDFEFDPEAGLLVYDGDAKSQKEFKEALTGGDAVSKPLEEALKLVSVGLAKAAKNRKKIGPEGRRVVKHDLCKKYFDICMFGAVLTAGTNFGQVRGPMQLTFARSVDPIQPRDLSIIRVAITKASDQARKTTEMGRKAIVPYGLYRLHGFFNPLLGRSRNAKGEMEKVVTETDLADFWDALQNLFTFDRSAARGEMCVRGLYVFTHENERGNAPAHRLFELVSVKPCGNSAREFSDYAAGITVPEAGAVKGIPGVELKEPTGVTLSVLAALKNPAPETTSGT